MPALAPVIRATFPMSFFVIFLLSLAVQSTGLKLEPSYYEHRALVSPQSGRGYAHRRAKAIARKGHFVSSNGLSAISSTSKRNNSLRNSTWTSSRLPPAPRDHSVRFPDSAPFVAGSFQAFVGDFRPQLFQRPRGRFVRMPFGVTRSPWHGVQYHPGGTDQQRPLSASGSRFRINHVLLLERAVADCQSGCRC
jgi:hypothetical protein